MGQKVLLMQQRQAMKYINVSIHDKIYGGCLSKGGFPVLALTIFNQLPTEVKWLNQKYSAVFNYSWLPGTAYYS